MQEGKYRARLVQYGFLSGNVDPATGQERPPQFFAQFSFKDETDANKKETWFGGFKELQPGKKTSQKQITFDTIELLGYTGTQIASLAGGVQSGILNTEKEFEIDMAYQKDAMGAVKCDDKGNPRFQIQWVNDPEKTGFKNLMTTQDAAVKIGGLNLDADIMASRAEKGGGQAQTGFNTQQNNGQQNNGQQNNGGGHVANNGQNSAQNYQQNNGQQNNNGQNNGQQNNGQQNFQQNNGQNNGQQNFQQPPNNGQNQQQHNQNMGFNQKGEPPF